MTKQNEKIVDDLFSRTLKEHLKELKDKKKPLIKLDKVDEEQYINCE